MAARLAVQQVELRAVLAFEQLRVGRRATDPVAHGAGGVARAGLDRPGQVARLLPAIDADRVVRGGAAKVQPPVGAVSRIHGFAVGVAAGVDDQRTAERGQLEVQAVEVAMVAFAEPAAVEDQVLRVGEWCCAVAPALAPIAAHDAVAAGRKVRHTRLRRGALRALRGDVEHVGAAVQLGALAQQVEMAARVAVRQAGHDAVGLVHMQAEFKAAQQGIVEGWRHRDAVHPGQAPEVQSVLQHQVVVISRQLAVHPVAEQVAGQIGDRLFQRKGSPGSGAAHLGQHHAGQEDRIELQRAVIALFGQVGAQVLDLFVQRVQQPAVEFGRDVRAAVVRGVADEQVQAVDPVLHPAPGHVGRDETHRRGAHPAVDQCGPALHIDFQAAALEGQAQADGIVELVQQDVPLDVGARVVQPFHRIGQLVRFAVELEAAAQQRVDLLGPRFVGVGDRVVAHRTRRAKVRQQRGVVQAGPGRQEDRASVGC